MGYDLLLTGKAERVTQPRFVEYFSLKPNYQVKDGQAWYFNESTGVYFLFEHSGFESSDADYDIKFSINYYRPEFFICEAEPEVKKVVNELHLLVNDQQLHDIGESGGSANQEQSQEYNEEDFLNGWLHGNECSYQSVPDKGMVAQALPESTLNSMWQWNANRDYQQAVLTDDVFVPRIMLFKYRDKICTGVVWPDAIPAVIPKVDLLLIDRKVLAPKKLFRKVEDSAVALWADFEPLFKLSATESQGETYYMASPELPKNIEEAVRALPTEKQPPELLPYDKVLNLDLVNKYNKRS